MTGRNTRIYGIDLLRLLSMIGIVVLHILSKGQLLWDARVVPLGISYTFLWLLNFACLCAVNCFALTSGFFSARKTTVKYANLAYIYLQVLFYSVFLSIGFWMANVEEFSFKSLAKAFLPVTTGAYWYVNAYICLFLFIPFLNQAVQYFSKTFLYTSVTGLFILFSVLPVIGNKDLFQSEQGYSVIWLIFMYLLGATLAQLNNDWKCPKRYLIMLYLLSVILGFLAQVYNTYRNIHQLETRELNLLSYDAPTTVLAAVALLLCFANIKINSSLKQKAIIICTPLYFSIYLIHLHPYVLKHLLQDKLGFFLNYPLPITILLIIFTTVSISLICMSIDYLRLKLFELLKIKLLLDNLERFLASKLSRLDKAAE